MREPKAIPELSHQPAASHEIMASTSEIVAAYVSNHEIQPEKLPGLIRDVAQTLARLGQEPVLERPKPAVTPKNSVFPDYIVCLEDGSQFKMLKRHLMTDHKMTPEQYRERWSLPSNYPMVAANYAETRSALAKQNGLGVKRMVAADVQKATVSHPAPRKAVRRAPPKKAAAKKAAAVEAQAG